MSVERDFWNPSQRQRAHGVETRNHKGSELPFSTLEARRKSPEARAFLDAMNGNEGAFEYLVIQITKGVPAIHSANAWRLDCKYKPEGVARAVVTRLLKPEATQKELAEMIGCDQSRYSRHWKGDNGKLNDVHRRTLKIWAAEAMGG